MSPHLRKNCVFHNNWRTCFDLCSTPFTTCYTYPVQGCRHTLSSWLLAWRLSKDFCATVQWICQILSLFSGLFQDYFTHYYFAIYRPPALPNHLDYHCWDSTEILTERRLLTHDFIIFITTVSRLKGPKIGPKFWDRFLFASTFTSFYFGTY